MVSEKVHSSQIGIHPSLFDIHQRQRKSNYMKPIQQHNIDAYQALVKESKNWSNPTQLILDVGCGTGMSSHLLAERNPEKQVIAVDRSLARLEKGLNHRKEKLSNLFFVRADIEDFARLLLDNNWTFETLYFFYPNPYPKSTQLNQRWHCHPIWPTLLRLSSKIEMRTNWHVYAQEWSEVLKSEQWSSVQLNELTIETPISLFEKKYSSSGHQLYQVIGTK